MIKTTMRRHNLRGAKIAVLSIGINYIGQPSELQGCINDSNNFMAYAQANFGVHIHHRVQMLDTLNGAQYPTKQNIQDQLLAILEKCRLEAYTHFWFHYSGHGGQQSDASADEKDRLDETLVPVDYASAGMISDDWLLSRVINRVPDNTQFFALIDACHSGSVFDLRFSTDLKAREPQRLVNPRSSTRPRAMMISGCRDNQYSYDVSDETYGASGAMSAAFLRAMNANRRAPVVDIVRRMRAELQARGYPQTPQLSSSRRLAAQSKIFGMGDL